MSTINKHVYYDIISTHSLINVNKQFYENLLNDKTHITH